MRRLPMVTVREFGPLVGPDAAPDCDRSMTGSYIDAVWHHQAPRGFFAGNDRGGDLRQFRMWRLASRSAGAASLSRLRRAATFIANPFWNCPGDDTFLRPTCPHRR